MLAGEEIQRRGAVRAERGLAADQVQPNGVDLSLEAVWRLTSAGLLGVASDHRWLSQREPLAFDADGWLALGPGAYGIRYAESVAMPTDCGGLAFPRSSLLRMGVHVPTAVWDAGYEGRGESLLIVTNPHGVRLERRARVAQLVLFPLSRSTTAYAGRYQGQ